MLVVLAWVYLGGGSRSFMTMYVTFVVVSILFDSIEFAEMPAFASMTTGELCARARRSHADRHHTRHARTSAGTM